MNRLMMFQISNPLGVQTASSAISSFFFAALCGFFALLSVNFLLFQQGSLCGPLRVSLRSLRNAFILDSEFWILNSSLWSRLRRAAFRISLVFLTSLFVLAALACSSPSYRGPGTPISYPGIQQQLAGELQSRYPRAFRLKQRLALRALDKQYDMLGYLVVNADGSLRAMGLGEMGGRIFDLALEQGQPKIHKKPEQMPENPLLDGVIGDLRHLYLPPAPASSLDLGVSVERGLSLALEYPADHTIEYSFRIQNHELFRSRESIGGRVVREAEYGDYRRIGGSEPIPGRIVLTNHRWHYTLEIQTLEIIPQ